MLFAFFTILQALDVSILNQLENKSWDIRSSLVSKSSEADNRIKIVSIDQKSLDFLEQEYSLTWPVPRDVYSHIIKYFHAAGASGIAFDILFTESSMQSVESDVILADSSKITFPVIHSFSLNSYEKYANSEKLELQQKTFEQIDKSHNFAKLNLVPSAEKFMSATLPYYELAESNHKLGYVQASPDGDGIFRRHFPISRMGNYILPSLPLSLYLTSFKDIVDFKKFQNSDSSFVIKNFRNEDYDNYSFASILQSQAKIESGAQPLVPLDEFKGKWIFIGCTAPGLLDFRPTSIEKNGFGTTFNASVFDNLINQSFIVRSSWIENILLMTGLIFIGLAISYFKLSPTKKTLYFFVWITVHISISLVFAYLNYWTPFVVPVFLILAFSFGSIAIDYEFEGKQHRFIKNAFQHYLSPALISEIIEHPDKLSLGGEKKQVSVFFSDIKDFTKASEKINPDVLVELLNEYLTSFTNIILKNGGTVDKYVGDAVMAFWNAPLDNENHSGLALKSAIECQEVLDLSRNEFLRKYGVFPATRIGLNTAHVNVGNFGSKQRFDYTIIGDGVNFASRLEAVNKVFGTSILLSESINQRCGVQYPTRQIGIVQVVGKNIPIEIYEPAFKENLHLFEKDNLNQFKIAIDLFNKGKLEEALIRFQQIERDPVAAVYVARIKEELKNNSFNPIWKLDSK